MQTGFTSITGFCNHIFSVMALVKQKSDAVQEVISFSVCNVNLVGKVGPCSSSLPNPLFPSHFRLPLPTTVSFPPFFPSNHSNILLLTVSRSSSGN
ncbi:hypothetical protein SLEP1_g9281 [Rubroshorea leprosula]|uniref:Uncharacterized protein n=1 Tax=Rubroshorea leprosula TaxID=152421 RepID=A0AAV5IAG0_9ROSI|nr:hypothetical protein SLEP1_g9281 [Rubroshorea leprosula]